LLIFKQCSFENFRPIFAARIFSLVSGDGLLLFKVLKKKEGIEIYLSTSMGCCYVASQSDAYTYADSHHCEYCQMVS
jgi:hypothetical protein